MTRLFTIAISTALLAACASSRSAPMPTAAVSPQRGQTAEQQAADTQTCRQFAFDQTGYNPAGQTARGAGAGAVIGGLAGAASGAAIGAATGGNVGESAAVGAAVGGVGGAATGGYYKYSKNRDGYNAAFASCMSNRGYTVT